MFEIKLYLYPRYWSFLPAWEQTVAEGMVLNDWIWLCFGVALHWPVDEAETGDSTEEENR